METSKTADARPPEKPVLFFDGVCNFCNGSVNFILDKDKSGEIRFSALQTETAERLLKPHAVNPADLDSVVLLADGRVYTRSAAALETLRRMGGGWRVLGNVGLAIPRPLRDGVYRLIARNRYKWFGKRETCRLPTADERARFLDVQE